MRALLALCLCGVLSVPATAARIDLTVEIPSLEVSEYHRPYVAIWIERPDNGVAANLAVWYQQKDTNEGAGTKWLADLRQWWRRSGREQSFPIDGVTGATRPVGQHKISFSSGTAPLGDLPAGSYRLVVEAAREVGGRELLTIPFEWPPQASQHLSAQGKNELGALALDLVP